MKLLGKSRRRLRIAVSAVVLLPALVGGPWLYMKVAAVGSVYAATDVPPQAPHALVLGARAYEDGTASPHLQQRVAAAVSLYERGLVSSLIMSGDGSPAAHDEPAVMRGLAEAAGVPSEAILEDPAGVDTRASCENAAALLDPGSEGGARVIVVTNEFHVARAVWLCRDAGLDADGVHTEIGGGKGTVTGNIREVAAAWKAVLAR